MTVIYLSASCYICVDYSRKIDIVCPQEQLDYGTLIVAMSITHTEKDLLRLRPLRWNQAYMI
jgi:hypothetical protein